MAKLVWTPQTAFRDYFYIDRKDIIANRSVFRSGVEYFVSRGGRGSAKTMSFVDSCVVEGSLRKVKVLATREMQNSIDESIKAEIEDAIYRRNLEKFYNITQNKITGLNGTEFIFRGLKNNIKSIKSISKVDIVLAEESENITKKSWDILLPSIRPPSGRDPIIIVIYNPDDELDDTHQRFTVNPPDRCVNRLINWRDNKYFPPHLERQRIHCLNTMPKKDYDNIWEGVPKGENDNAIIQRDWIRGCQVRQSQRRL